MLLKNIYNLSDEGIVTRWMENPYMQYFTGEKVFQKRPPMNPIDLTKFRKRIGTIGAEKIFKISLLVNAKEITGKEMKLVMIDSTFDGERHCFPGEPLRRSHSLSYGADQATDRLPAGGGRNGSGIPREEGDRLDHDLHTEFWRSEAELLSEDESPEEVPETSGYRTGHRPLEIRSTDDAELPERNSERCHQYADGGGCIQHEALDEQKCFFFFCFLA